MILTEFPVPAGVPQQYMFSMVKPAWRGASDGVPYIFDEPYQTELVTRLKKLPPRARAIDWYGCGVSDAGVLCKAYQWQDSVRSFALRLRAEGVWIPWHYSNIESAGAHHQREADDLVAAALGAPEWRNANGQSPRIVRTFNSASAWPVWMPWHRQPSTPGPMGLVPQTIDGRSSWCMGFFSPYQPHKDMAADKGGSPYHYALIDTLNMAMGAIRWGVQPIPVIADFFMRRPGTDQADAPSPEAQTVCLDALHTLIRAFFLPVYVCWNYKGLDGDKVVDPAGRAAAASKMAQVFQVSNMRPRETLSVAELKPFDLTPKPIVIGKRTFVVPA